MVSELKSFSPKQLEILGWWHENSPHKDKVAIICDGSVRSGKTVCMSLSFVLWAFSNFNNQNFALCGKTILSIRRNLLFPLTKWLSSMEIDFKEKLSSNYIDISVDKKTNRFYLFGGKDESSASYIQGLTLAGVLFDEVALMPRSFVEQALARCSVDGSKFWFNCNPEHPYHWFYKEWIQKCNSKNALYIHFVMSDNPSLSKEIIERYESLYSGVFYQRYVLGQWVAAHGRVYPMFDNEINVVDIMPEKFNEYIVSCDYGTVNPCSFGLWGESGGIWYRICEYYYDSKVMGDMRTDEEHFEQLASLIGDRRVRKIIVDPSAASFIQVIRKHTNYCVEKADNNVIDGIRKVSDAIKQKKILFGKGCLDSIREFCLYCWKEDSETPIKQNDHAMDDIRYFVMGTLEKNDRDSFYALSVNRK